MRWIWGLGPAWVLLLGGAARAQLLEPEPALTLTYRAIYHDYQVRLFSDLAADGTRIDSFRNVNPFSSSLDVGGWALGPSGDIDVVVGLRYRTDFGTGFRLDTPGDAGIPAVDGASAFQILTLYAEWRNVLPGLLDLRLGRQLLLDDLDWFSLDGLKATVHLARSATATVDLEVYTGLPVRYDVLFSSDPFLADGFRISDGPSVGFGAAARGRFFRDLSASLSYRQVLQLRSDAIEVFRADPGGDPMAVAESQTVGPVSAGKSALEESRLGASLAYGIPSIGLDLFAAGSFDLVFGRTELLRGGVSYAYDRRLRAQAELMNVRPRFAADSIFNVFNIFPYNRARAEISFEVLPGLVLEGGYFLLLVQGDTKAGQAYRGQEAAHGPSGGARYRVEALETGLYFEGSTNSGGDYAWGGNYRRLELWGRYGLWDELVALELRLGTLTVQNDWFERVDQNDVADPLTSYSAELGVRANPLPWLSFRGSFVKNFEAVLEGSYRALSMLEIRY